MNSRERPSDSTNKSAYPSHYETLNDAGGADAATRLTEMKPDCADWPELESAEIKELVLSIIATSIRLNPFRPSENDKNAGLESSGRSSDATTAERP